MSDTKILSALFEQYKESFTLFAFSYIKEMETAEDICMEAFMVYWEKRTDLPETANIPAYILTVIKNKALNLLRNEQSRNLIQEQLHAHRLRELDFRIATLETCDPEELFSSELKQLINNTVQALPEQTRKIFLKSRYEAKTNKEIASELGLSIKTVEFHITKALKVFRASLKDYLPLLPFLLQMHL